MGTERPVCVLPLLLLAGTAACRGGTSAQTAAVVRDSAGITIVESARTESPDLYVLSEPVLEIGEVEGAEEYQLYNVRQALRTADGSMAVALDTEVRWYAADGSFIRRVGREGAGPGEFRRISYMTLLAGDTVLVFDGSNRRITVLAPDGSHIRDFAPPSAEGRVWPVLGATRDGTLLTRSSTQFPAGSTEMHRDTIAYSVVRGDSAVTLLRYPGPETAVRVNERGGGVVSISIAMLPFARLTHTAAGPDHFFIGSSDMWRIDVWSTDGKLARIVRVAEPVEPVTEAMLEQAIEAGIARSRARAESRGVEFDEAAMRRQPATQQHAPFVPAFAGLLPTRDGGVWVQDYVMPADEGGPERWTMFDAEGQRLGVIDLPPRFTPMHVSGDTILGLYLDDLDVPYVRAYTFSRVAPQ